jgi:hypothetical protein
VTSRMNFYPFFSIVVQKTELKSVPSGLVELYLKIYTFPLAHSIHVKIGHLFFGSFRKTGLVAIYVYLKKKGLKFFKFKHSSLCTVLTFQ